MNKQEQSRKGGKHEVVSIATPQPRCGSYSWQLAQSESERSDPLRAKGFSRARPRRVTLFQIRPKAGIAVPQVTRERMPSQARV